VKPAKLAKVDREASKAMLAYLSLFSSLDDAQTFQRAAHPSEQRFLPPCVRIVKDGGQPSAIYWRWLAAMAEAWS
jgi:hypothetical protein